ncbi:MAG TPA: hypothetical protein V6C58_03740 [Allocoleopsis sp.]
MRCPTCQAVLEEGKPVILRQGAQSKIKHYNRVCIYAIERGKDCINNVRLTDKNLSWDAEFKQLESDFQQTYNYLIQEM